MIYSIRRISMKENKFTTISHCNSDAWFERTTYDYFIGIVFNIKYSITMRGQTSTVLVAIRQTS